MVLDYEIGIVVPLSQLTNSLTLYTRGKKGDAKEYSNGFGKHQL
jgi:hypothetical protein